MAVGKRFRAGEPHSNQGEGGDRHLAARRRALEGDRIPCLPARDVPEEPVRIPVLVNCGRGGLRVLTTPLSRMLIEEGL